MAGRVTQVAGEAPVAATSASGRVTQVAGEAPIYATSELLRVTQLVGEVVIVLGGLAFVGEPGGAVW